MRVCVVIPFILDVRLVNAPAGVRQDFSTFLVRCLPSFLVRGGFSRPFPSSTVKSNFIVPVSMAGNFLEREKAQNSTIVDWVKCSLELLLLQSRGAVQYCDRTSYRNEK